MAETVSFPWYDPSQIPVPLPPAPDNPLVLLPDGDLVLLHQYLTIACGRSKVELKNRHRHLICANAYVLSVEKLRRGLPGA